MAFRNRTGSSFRPAANSQFSKTAYMYPQQRFLSSAKKNFASTNASFQQKQRSLTNSVLDYQHNKLNESLPDAKAFKEPKSIEDHHQKQQNRLQMKPPLMRPQTGHVGSYSRKRCVVDDENFRKTTSKLENINFRHHDPELCVCAYCTCGRHLCKLHVIKPDLHNSTTYRGDYNSKVPLHNLRFRPVTGHYSKDPYVDLNSTYGKDFDGKNGDISRPKPEDCLNVGGPLSGLTSYSSGFPGHRGHNQYIKPTNNTHLNGILPFSGNSIYQKSYIPKAGGPEDQARWINHFKNGEPWLGNSTYRDNFKGPGSDDYASKVRIVQKRELDPDFNHQYETTYKNDFLNKGSGVCPAKIQLQGKIKGKFTETKGNFNQNSDFKAMSPQFHAISTSRHSYV